MKKAYKIFLNIIPILAMIGLIPLIKNDYALAAADAAIIAATFLVRRERNDFTVLFFGFAMMIIFECIFVSTGVETFVRNSMFGLIPVWLPVLWSYGFVAIKRSAAILDS